MYLHRAAGPGSKLDMATRGRKGSASGGDGSLFFLTDGRLKTPNRHAWPTTSTPAAAVDQIKFNTHAADLHTAPQGGVLSGASRGWRAQSETDIWRDSLCFSYGGEKSSTDVIIISMDMNMNTRIMNSSPSPQLHRFPIYADLEQPLQPIYTDPIKSRRPRCN